MNRNSHKFAIEKIVIHPFANGTKCTHIYARDGPDVIIDNHMIIIPEILPKGYWRCSYCDTVVKTDNKTEHITHCEPLLDAAFKRKETLDKANRTFGKQIKEMIGDCVNCEHKKHTEICLETYDE